MKMVPLGEVTSLLSGGTPDRKNSSFYDGDIPWITGADIDVDGQIHPRHHITKTAINKSATRVAPDNTVLLVTRTAVGKTAVPDFPVAFSQDLTALTPHAGLDLGYLDHFLRSRVDYFARNSRGATIKGVTRRVVSELPIPLPPLDGQRRIAAILDKADAIRQKRRQTIAHLDTLAQSVFDKLFEARESREWPVTQIGDVSDSILGKMLDKKRSDALPQHPYIRNANVQWFRFDLTDVSTMGFHDSELQKYSLERGDVLMCEGGEPGRCAIWKSDNTEMKFQKAVHRIRLSDELRPEYFVRYFKQLTQKGGLKDYASTSTISHLTAAKLKTIPIAIPPIDLQIRFTHITESIHKQTEHLIKTNSLQDTLFSSIQSRAFRGEL